MELLGVRQPFIQFQEEKYQMLELNQRLESYLGRVKLLEEENKLLREEIHTLKSSRDPPGQHKAQEEALSQARRMMEEAWRKKDHVELEVENLIEDMEMVNIQRQKAKTAQAEAQKKLTESRKELEEERRAQIWLREKVGQLEKDLLLQMQVHQENMETLQASLKQIKPVLMAPQHTQTTSIPDLGQEYSHRVAQAWQEATNNYQRQFGRLEESLNQAKANMAKVHQEKREKQHQVQHLAKELDSMKTKRQMLEKHAVQQREEQMQELQHLQAQVDALELEKDSLGQQIDSMMVDRQNLLQVKMSLGLEVATYRALLDSEGLRIDRPKTNKTNSAVFLDPISKPIGTHQTLQTIAASCHFSNTVSTSHRSITSSRTLLTSATPSWTQGTPQRTPTKISLPEKSGVHISEESKKAAEESVDYLQREKVHEDMAITSTLPKTAAEPEPQLKPEDMKVEDEPKQFQKAQLVESKTEESALISVTGDQPSSLSQTPEAESWAGPFTDPAEVSEEGKDEEVSVEMARISHAPKVTWEENKTVAEDEKDDASEMDVRSENISESFTVSYGDLDDNDDTLTSSHIGTNSNILVSSFLKQGALSDFSCQEEANEDLMRVDEQDVVSNISEEVTEQMNSETEAEIDSINEWDRQEEIEPENEMKVTSPKCEVEEEGEMSIETELKNKTDENVTEREEGEEIEVIERDSSVQDGGVDSPKNTDHQESIEKTVPPAEAHSVQRVNEGCPLPEESELPENQGDDDDDDSQNISASWRTDPGECNSYSQENTLADPRPLIQYKSDEETDGNAQVSHLIGETSDSEDEKERADRGHLNESASKRFNTMEDLTEEPDMDVIGEMMTGDIVSKDALDDDRACIMLQSGSGVYESSDLEKEGPRIEPRGIPKEDTDDDMRRDENHDVEVYEQNENPLLTENQHIHTEQLEYETVHSYESQEHVHKDHPSSFSETSQVEQLESSFETSPTLTMFQDAATTKEPENLLDVSMHTNIDLMDSQSLQSEINSQPSIMTSDMPNSDQEECNSSEDESPNASQCFQNTSLLAAATLTEQPLTFTNGGFKADPVSANNEEVPSEEKSTEETKASQIYDWENSNIWGKSMSITEEASANENSGVFPVSEIENLGSPNKMPSVAENIFGKFEEHLEKSFSEKVMTVMDFESDNLEEEEEFQSKEKKSEFHSLFSTNLEEDFWSKGKVEMAATYDPSKTVDLNQDMVLGEEWKDMEGIPAANGNPTEEMDILKGRDDKRKDEQPKRGEMVLSDDSVDEGDSWSSGDE
ncbi:nestin [Pimephales promelas]|uniref:nestin n=1 Tax=Pimephales promelas TaxID=90988 RepID=UPI00195570F4|nr:nestin [Pimephales promelas]KAG1947942.1 vimentin [Pimephales promelas]